MITLLQLWLLVLLWQTEVRAFSAGPPLSRCETIAPHHSHHNPQSLPSPFNISVSKSSYTRGEELNVTIFAVSGRSFKGFILQARGNESSVAWPVGEFTQIPSGAQYLYCSGGDPKNTISHANTAKQTWISRQFTWKAPSKSAGNVQFWATIVESYDKFWRNVTSSVISGPSVENVTRGVPSSRFEINKTGCGQTKGCFSLPSNCTRNSDCNFLFTYQVSGGNVTIEMSAKQRWAAVGFNEKKFMDKMDSIMCATLGNNLVEVRHYYSHGHNLIRQDLVGSSDTFLEKIIYEDGGISCRFKRRLIPDASQLRDLREKLYLLFAHGATTPTGSGQYHYRENRTYTSEPVDLSVPATVVDEQNQPTTTSSTRNTITKDGCSETKSCHSEPSDCTSSSDCNYLVTYKPVGDDEVEFEISAKDQWAAIGFNKQKNEMPGTDALICADISGEVNVDHYLADQGYNLPTKTTPRPIQAISQSFAASDGGVVRCRFRRKKKASNMVDLNKAWFLVFARGPMNGDVIGKHTISPSTSSKQIDLSTITTIITEKEQLSMIQAHGCLMVIAWIGFASVGIFMARYMKAVFGEELLLGTKIWFTFHRSLMVSTVVITIVAIILVFIHAARWTEEAGAHPIIGIIVLALAVIQPIMALFRPHPGEDKRFIFNWAHRGVGIAALILAVVTIFLGIRLDHVKVDDAALYSMIVYCVGVVVVIIFDIFLAVRSVGTVSFNTAAGEGDNSDGGHVQLEPIANQHSSTRKLMLGFVVLLVCGVSVALIVLIALADAKGGSHGEDHHH